MAAEVKEAAALANFTVEQLKGKLRASGLSTSGRKEELIKRLSSAAAERPKKQKRAQEPEDAEHQPKLQKLSKFAASEYKNARANPTAPLTREEFFVVAGPLANLPPQRWTVDLWTEERVNLVFELGADLDQEDRVAQALLADMEKFQGWMECASNSAKHPVKVEDLVVLIEELHDEYGISHTRWDSKSLEKIIELYKRANSFDGRGKLSKYGDTVLGFMDQFELYLGQNPSVRKLLDPFVVVADLGNAALVPHIAAGAAAFPGAGAVVPAAPAPIFTAAGPTPYVWSFPTYIRAAHFVGFLQHNTLLAGGTAATFIIQPSGQPHTTWGFAKTLIPPTTDGLLRLTSLRL